MTTDIDSGAKAFFGHEWLWREFYNIHLNIWPDTGRPQAAWNAFKLAYKTWKAE